VAEDTVKEKVEGRSMSSKRKSMSVLDGHSARNDLSARNGHPVGELRRSSKNGCQLVASTFYEVNFFSCVLKILVKTQFSFSMHIKMPRVECALIVSTSRQVMTTYSPSLRRDADAGTFSCATGWCATGWCAF
jgi:hypothetical protein